jgi:hypothetical protein
MTVTAEQLRKELDEPADQWTNHDTERADQILASCLRRVINHIGRAAYDNATTDQDEDALGLVDDITLSYAARRFVNPEQALQRRSGADNSVSLADGSEAASGLTVAERKALSTAFARHGARQRRAAFVVPYANQP